MTQNVDGFCDNQWNKNNIQGLLNMATYLAKSSQHQPSMKHDGIPRCLSSLPLRILKTGTFDRHELDHTYIYIYNYIYIYIDRYIYIYTHTDSHTYIYIYGALPTPKDLQLFDIIVLGHSWDSGNLRPRKGSRRDKSKRHPPDPLATLW